MQQQTRTKEEDSRLKINYKAGYSPVSWARIFVFFDRKKEWSGGNKHMWKMQCTHGSKVDPAYLTNIF